MQSYIAQASDWELQGEYRHAVECYLKVTEDVTDDVSVIIHAQTKAIFTLMFPIFEIFKSLKMCKGC